MKYNTLGHNLTIFIAILMLSLPVHVFASQHGTQSTPATDDLQKRVTQLWQAKVAGDRETIYDMADQKFRDATNRTAFTKKSGLQIQGFEIAEIEINDDGKSGSSMVIFKVIQFAQLMEISVKEIWLLEDGVWNIKMSDPGNPFAKRTK